MRHTQPIGLSWGEQGMHEQPVNWMFMHALTASVVLGVSWMEIMRLDHS